MVTSHNPDSVHGSTGQRYRQLIRVLRLRRLVLEHDTCDLAALATKARPQLSLPTPFIWLE